MGFDPIEIAQATNKALAILRGGGEVGYVEHGDEIFRVALTDGQFDQQKVGAFLEVGKTYVVTTDSGSFTAVATGVGLAVWIGNYSLYNDTGEDTGESFLFFNIPKSGYVKCVDANGGSNFKVATPETIHPIDPKYLPGVCLPVVELSTLPTTSGATLTEAESAALDEVATSGMPVAIKFTLESGMTNNAVFTSLSADGMAGYSTVIPGESLTGYVLMNTGSGWQFMTFPY